MNETNNLKLNKPEKTDFVSIGSFNENSDKIDALGAPEFDDSGTVNGITDFTTYLSTLVSGTSIFNFFRNLKAGFQYVLHVGQLVNNTVTNNDNLPASASAVYKLQQSLNITSSNLTGYIENANGQYWKFPDGTLICSSQKTFTNIAITNAWGVLFETASALNLGDYPYPFASIPTGVFATPIGQGIGGVERVANITTTSWGNVFLYMPMSVTLPTIKISLMAIGRWKN